MEWHEAAELLRPELTETEATAKWEKAWLLPVDGSGQVLVDGDEPQVFPAEGAPGSQDFYLGQWQGRSWFVRTEAAAVTSQWADWRQVAPQWRQLVTAAVWLGRWHAGAPNCEHCGGATRPTIVGTRRVCVDCGELQFARQDPAVIVAVTDRADRLLLVQHVAKVAGRHSLVAGFIEPGESAEQAVHREVLEEVGLPLDQLHYFGSQPWPMPRSLMLGFFACTTADLPEPDGAEIAAARFVARAELDHALRAGELQLPTGASIARRMISAWQQGRLGCQR